jgi:GTP-binding protein HflX
MALELFGNTRGLAPRERHDLERLYRRRLDPERLVSLELARELFERATAVGRKVALLVSREGEVLQVIVGTRERVYLPDMGRYRVGQGRLRRVRLIFSDLSTHATQPKIPADIYGDLEKLKLDAVVGVKGDGNDAAVTYAYLDQDELSDEPKAITVTVATFRELQLDFAEFIAEQERKLVIFDSGTKSTNLVRAVAISVRPVSQVRADSAMVEILELCRTAGIQVVAKVTQRKNPDPRTILGKGRLEEVVLLALRRDATMLIFDAELTPSQWRAVTNLTELKIIDRSMLILDIFARRASSGDGRLQVELAQLRYNLPRLQEQDAGMSRLSGGIGGRGPGETKLEIGRRRTKDRIAMLERKLKDLESKRELRSRVRTRSAVPLVALVGYTNAGKSTLFNALTNSTVLAEDKLFATLDPTQRKVGYPFGESGGIVSFILSDTVGFIRELPEELVRAFKATLDELTQAALLIHVVDAADPELGEKMAAVDRTLAELKLDQIPKIVALNKADLLEATVAEQLVRETNGMLLSGVERKGLRELKTEIVARLSEPVAVPETAVATEI